ncbi:MAG: hypothetical protein AB7E13_11755 [Arcobacteraceae bacterium]
MITSMNVANEQLNKKVSNFMNANKNMSFTYCKGVFEIINDSTGTILEMFDGDKELNGLIYPDDKLRMSKALFFIRDQILQETGKRIWGLTFTLYPDGKHEIEYDYNVPEGFNEQGEYIGEECTNEAVSGFFGNIRKIGTDEFELK